MKQRQWSIVRGPGGSEDSQQLASALAEIADPDLMQSLIDAVTLMNRLGGEVYITPRRFKFDSQGNRLEDEAKPGQYETLAYMFQYSPYASYEGAPKEKDSKLHVPDEDFLSSLEEPEPEPVGAES